jgi:hypothetical protein
MLAFFIKEKEIDYSGGLFTPGRTKPEPVMLGQFPRPAGSPPMRTNCPTDGVGPLRTNIMYHPGGHVCASGGEVTLQALPLQEIAGKRVL